VVAEHGRGGVSPRSRSAARPGSQAMGGARPPPPRRVALVTEFYYPHLGGVCEHVHFLAAELARLGWAADIVTGGIAGAAPHPNVIRLGRSTSVFANGAHARVTLGRRLRADVREVLREGRYDVVHVHTPLAPTLPLLAIDEADSPVVGTFHTQLAERVLTYDVARQHFQRRMDRLSAAIAVSPTAADSFARYFQADWTIIPNGIDASLFRPDAPPPADMEGGVPTVLFLGRMDPRNGLGTLLQAFTLLQRQGGAEARLVVVGGGPLRPFYEAMAGRVQGVRFVGPVLDDRPGYYANSDVYVCPSSRASFGVTLLEAMACGTPVVCSDAEGFRHVVTHGREALVTPIGDVEALAGALEALLTDGELRARMGEAGRARALEFAWPGVASRVVDVYERVLGSEWKRCAEEAAA